jgi:hypothetical protein
LKGRKNSHLKLKIDWLELGSFGRIREISKESQ